MALIEVSIKVYVKVIKKVIRQDYQKSNTSRLSKMYTKGIKFFNIEQGYSKALTMRERVLGSKNIANFW